jgi:hypothetical protein
MVVDGRLEMLDKCVYEGGFMFDKKHGEGVYSWLDGKKLYGTWEADKEHGKSILRQADNKQKIIIWNMGKVK